MQQDYQGVHVLPLHKAVIKWMWELSERSWPAVPLSFQLQQGFVDYILDPRVVVLKVGDGVVFVDDIVPGVSAKVHPLFDRGKMSRAERVEVTRWSALWIFDQLGVHRIWGETPAVQPLLRTMTRFARDVGFR